MCVHACVLWLYPWSDRNSQEPVPISITFTTFTPSIYSTLVTSPPPAAAAPPWVYLQIVNTSSLTADNIMIFAFHHLMRNRWHRLDQEPQNPSLHGGMCQFYENAFFFFLKATQFTAELLQGTISHSGRNTQIHSLDTLQEVNVTPQDPSVSEMKWF